MVGLERGCLQYTSFSWKLQIGASSEVTDDLSRFALALVSADDVEDFASVDPAHGRFVVVEDVLDLGMPLARCPQGVEDGP